MTTFIENDWTGYRDAHLEPDGLLIYQVDRDTVRLERTGSYTDLLD